MFKEKDFYREAVAACMKALAKLNRGDVFPWIEFESIVGIDRSHPCWTHLCKKLKKRMREDRGITLWPVVGVGYKLSLETEQANLIPDKLQRRGVRRITSAINEVTALPESNLPISLRRIKHYRIDSMRTTRRLLKRAVRDQGQEAKKTETMPRRRPQGEDKQAG